MLSIAAIREGIRFPGTIRPSPGIDPGLPTSPTSATLIPNRSNSGTPCTGRNPDADHKILGTALQNVARIVSNHVGVMGQDEDPGIETVAEIFVCVNASGTVPRIPRLVVASSAQNRRTQTCLRPPQIPCGAVATATATVASAARLDWLLPRPRQQVRLSRNAWPNHRRPRISASPYGAYCPPLPKADGRRTGVARELVGTTGGASDTAGFARIDAP